MRLFGCFQVVLTLALGIGSIHYVRHVERTWAMPGAIIVPVIFTLLLISGIGIILKKKKLFVCAFYAYTFIVMTSLHDLYGILTAKKVGSNLDRLNEAIRGATINHLVFVIAIILVMVLMLRKDVITRFAIQRKRDIYRHIVGACVVFLFFAAFWL